MAALVPYTQAISNESRLCRCFCRRFVVSYKSCTVVVRTDRYSKTRWPESQPLSGTGVPAEGETLSSAALGHRHTRRQRRLTVPYRQGETTPKQQADVTGNQKRPSPSVRPVCRQRRLKLHFSVHDILGVAASSIGRPPHFHEQDHRRATAADPKDSSWASGSTSRCCHSLPELGV